MYSLKFPGKGKHDVVHVNRLKPFFSQDDRPKPPEEEILKVPSSDISTQDTNQIDEENNETPDNTPQQNVPENTPNESDIFQVEKILNKRTRKGVTKFLVKWAGYPMSACTWEVEQNFLDKTPIEIFNRKHSEKKGSTKKSRKKDIHQTIAELRAVEIYMNSS